MVVMLGLRLSRGARVSDNAWGTLSQTGLFESAVEAPGSDGLERQKRAGLAA